MAIPLLFSSSPVILLRCPTPSSSISTSLHRRLLLAAITSLLRRPSTSVRVWLYRALSSPFFILLRLRFHQQSFSRFHQQFFVSAGVACDARAYTVLIGGYIHSGSLSHAFGVLKRMINDGCEPSLLTFSILIKHLFIQKQLRGGETDESFVSIPLAVDFWKLVDLQTVMELVENIQMLGVAFTSGMYTTLVTGFCRQGRAVEALSMVNHMTQEGIAPNENIINSLIRCYCMVGMYDDALTWVKTLIQNAQLSHLDSYKLLICGLYDVGKIEEAKTAFSSLLHYGYNNDEVVLKLLNDGLLKRGHPDRCLELLTIMKNFGCQPTPLTYTKLVEAILSCSEGAKEHKSC